MTDAVEVSGQPVKPEAGGPVTLDVRWRCGTRGQAAGRDPCEKERFVIGGYEFKWLGRLLEPGEWTSLPIGHWALSDGGSIFLCCPECGMVSRMPHEVHDSGGVSPSVVCPYNKKELRDPPCTMHLQPVILLGWTGGYKPKN